ncbi:MAG: TonB-dependent receptor [Flavobacteriales bacterium]|nr:TonB-dependent receptor [Flavobacteriales bacterium]
MKQFSTLLLLLIAVATFAQKGTIRGTIYDKSSGEPVIFTNVLVKELGTGSSSDINGVYQIGPIEAGTYTLVVSNVEFETFTTTVKVDAGKIVVENIYLEKGKVLDAVNIDAKKVNDKTNVNPSTIKATKKEISAVVSTGGEPDLATYFQTVPGVVTTGDQGGQMYIRGGSPVQNKVLLDGMIIYNPFHSIGFFSVFDTELIKNADIYTGGFGSEYGGRISSVMDVTTIDGNKKRMAGKVSVNPFGAKLTLEGPLKKLREDDLNSGTISYVFSAKTSYLEQTSKILYDYVDTAGLPFNYTDVFGKITFSNPNGSKFNVFGYNFRDQVKWQALSNLNWNSYGVGTNFVLLPTGSPVQIGGKFGYSSYQINMSEKDALTGVSDTTRTSGVNNFNLGFDFKYFVREDVIKYGIEVSGFSTNFAYLNSVGREISQNANTTEIGAYLDYKINRGLLVINPGFRAQYYASLGNFSPEPRLGIKYNVNENFRIKGAAGVYSQNLIAANSDRDVVNLFYGFIAGPDNLQERIITSSGEEKERKHSLQKATHAILGFEQDLGKHVSINIEGYYKWFTQLTNINRNKIYDDNSDYRDKPDVLKKDFIIETGSAKGVDMVLKYSTDRLYIWFVYSLGKVDRWNGVDTTYAPIFDRRHNINFVSTYFLDKDHKWEVDLRWNFGSGLPFTQTQGYYQNIDFSTGIGTDITTANTNELGLLFSDLNGGRLPAYHRLDFSIKRTIEINDHSKMEVNASITNAYSRKNIFYVDRITSEKVYQLPILPSIGFNWKF